MYPQNQGTNFIPNVLMVIKTETQNLINSITKMIKLYQPLDEYPYFPSCTYQVNISPPPYTLNQ